MLAEVIDRVHKMARRSPGGLTFGDRDNMVPMRDDHDEGDGDDGDDSEYNSDAASDYEPGHHIDGDEDSDASDSNANDSDASDSDDSGSSYLPDDDDDGGANRDSDHPLEEQSTGVPADDDDVVDAIIGDGKHAPAAATEGQSRDQGHHDGIR
jgi:hypothetical protein